MVYIVHNTIGNLTQDDQIRCFENAERHLSDDGVFVLDCRVATAPSRPGHQITTLTAVTLIRVDIETVGLVYRQGRDSS